MKKIFLTVTLLLCVILVKAQTVNNIPLTDIDVEYIEIVGTSVPFSKKILVQIDFGQKSKFFSAKETFIKDAEGKSLDFNSTMDALNFMTKYGFEFVSAYALTISSQNVYHYLLRNTKNKSKN